MRPGAELRVAPVARQRAEDLDPDLLRDVRRQVRVPARQPAHDQVDVRRVPGPERPERAFIAGDRAADEQGFVIHVHQLVTAAAEEGLLSAANRSLRPIV